MPKPPLISIPLDIPDVRVLQTELTKTGELILTIESTLQQLDWYDPRHCTPKPTNVI